ncbi:MAG: class I SAM-dependent methyltransferase [Methylomicrobium sp.]
MPDFLTVPQGRFELVRLPIRQRELLQAYDAADEYVLNDLAEQGLPSENVRMLIVNDAFGALTVALSAYKPVVLSDSFLSLEATRMNLSTNGKPVDQIERLTSLDLPEGVFDWIVIKAPKTLALLEYQLIRLRPAIGPGTRIVTAGMVKHLSPSVARLLERIVGPTSLSLARKKARLLFTEPDPSRPEVLNPYPIVYRLEGTNYMIVNHANVFSRDSLDIGTRFFLKHIGHYPNARHIVDLGCGNGVVGLIAAEQNPQAVVHFVDESFMAVASAQTNFEAAFGGGRQATFRPGDGLSGFASASVDVILCNPPFHQQNTVGDMIAANMFRQARRALTREGVLWVIGNRHLGYHRLLKKGFGRVDTVDANSKFVILKAML